MDLEEFEPEFRDTIQSVSHLIKLSSEIKTKSAIFNSRLVEQKPELIREHLQYIPNHISS